MAGILDIFDLGAFDLSDPDIMTGLGMQIAGTYLKQRQFDAIRRGQERVRAAEQIRQNALQTEANERAKASTKRLSAGQQETDRQRIAAENTQRFQPAASEAAIQQAEYGAGNPGAPAVVGENIARQVQNAVGKGRNYAGAAGRFASYPGQAVRAGTELTRLGQDIGRVANFSRGNTRILAPSLQAQLYSRGRNEAFGSDLANVIGQMRMIRAFERGK